MVSRTTFRKIGETFTDGGAPKPRASLSNTEKGSGVLYRLIKITETKTGNWHYGIEIIEPENKQHPEKKK